MTIQPTDSDLFAALFVLQDRIAKRLRARFFASTRLAWTERELEAIEWRIEETACVCAADYISFGEVGL